MSLRAAVPAVLFALLAGCATPKHEVNWQRLRVGMGHAEVEGLLGKPSSTYVPPRSEHGAPPPARGERWQYGDSLSSIATRAMFPDEADERAWVVFFGADGAVSGFRPPAWDTAHRSVDPVAVSPPARASSGRPASVPPAPDR